MGVKNLIKFIQQYANDAIKTTHISDYKDSTIGIDMNLMMYKLIYGIRGLGYDITNKKSDGTDVIVTHLHQLLMKFVGFRQQNINPVFVFDVAFPEIKNATMEERKKVREKLAEKYKDSDTDKGKRIYYYMKNDITQDEIDDMRKLITLFGYTIVDAKEEADSQLVQLFKAGLIDYIASDDMDILLFGSGNLKMLKKFSVDPKREIQEINLTKVLESSGLTQDRLIQLGTLLGTDYCNIKTVSPNKAYKLIQEYGVIQNIPDVGHKCDSGLAYFRNPPVHNITSLQPTQPPDTNRIKSFLRKFYFKEKYIKKIFKELNF